MRPLLKKEIRLVLPALLVAVAVAAVPPWLIGHPGSFADGLWVPGIGAVILAVSAFGREFSLGTFSGLLSQPVPRARIMGTKSLVLLVALLSVLASYYISSMVWVRSPHTELTSYIWMHTPLQKQMAAIGLMQRQVLIMGGVGVAVILAGGLWTTLVFRQMVAAFWITVLVPCFLLVTFSWPSSRLSVADAEVLNLIAFLLYALLALLCSWRLFRHAEDTGFAWGGKTLPSPTELIGWKQDCRSSAGIGPMATLVRQEISLHQTSLTAAIVLLVLNLGAIGLRASGWFPRNSAFNSILEPLPIFWFLLPLMLGASAVAEERRLGMLESRLCLPISRRKQWLLKLSVTVGLGLIAGVGALLLTDVLSRLLGIPPLFGSSGLVFYETVWLLVTCVGLTLLGFYASSLSKSALQALGTAFALALITIPTIALMTTGDFRDIVPTAWIPIMFWLALGLAIPVLSYHNFGQLNCGQQQVLQNLVVIGTTIGTVGILAVGVYTRAWELVISLEPRHGPATITGPGQAQIAGMWRGRKLAILLPDGRLWISCGNGSRRTEGNLHYTPTSGGFSTMSNWTAVASSLDEMIALRSDGTLWSLFLVQHENENWKLVRDEPMQVGSASNWTAIAAGSRHLLALKSDGTLWGWGQNDDFQVLDGPKVLTNGPVRVGDVSDWVAVYARPTSTVGVRRDGSTWEWGRIWEQGEDGRCGDKIYKEPRHSIVDLRNLKEFRAQYQSDFLLYNNGSLWLSRGAFHGRLLGTDLQQNYAANPVQVGIGHTWECLTVWAWGDLLALSGEGMLWKSEWTGRNPRVIHPSRHNDWIAVGQYLGSYVSLAADGTVTCWPSYRGNYALASSRWPLTSFNIFDGRE